MEPMMRKNRNVLKIDIRVGQLRMTSDETRVRQCLLNLLSNAAKFSRDSTVELQVERAGSDQILFHVIDAGPGLSRAADQPAISAVRTIAHRPQARRNGSGSCDYAAAL